ncbi:MAG: Flp pilus assembly protein CpaB [Vicinamibacterales bacterium]
MNRNTRTFIVLAVAIVVAGVATFLVNQAIQRRPIQQVQAPQTQVVVAARRLETGTRLTEADVKLVGWPESARVAGSFAKLEDVVNRGVVVSMLENEPLTDTKLAAVGAGAGLPPSIPPGMRALSVRVNEVVGVAGFVTPGTRVDVLVTLRDPANSITKVVTSNVQVLAAGTALEQDKSKSGQAMPSSVVTLLLSPEDAERVVLATDDGAIMLALRNPLDQEPTKSNGTRRSTLVNGGEDPAPQAPPPPRAVPRPKPVVVAALPPSAPPEPKPYLVEAIRGAKRTEEALR